MKSLLFAAFALSLILVVSAQCDIDTDAIVNCTQDYANMVSKLYLYNCIFVCGYLIQCNSLHGCITSILYVFYKFMQGEKNFSTSTYTCKSLFFSCIIAYSILHKIVYNNVENVVL